ncbi:MAG: peptidyl-tRNA hydrolase [Candidatus Aenigmarchaeota archaeon]|nr:peptidyl-tRNA hydrolase [Candidatus Aenigmarchaeota archaeon]
MAYKQVIVVRNDIKMSPAKLAVQVAHAALSAASQTGKKTVSAWQKEGQKKVVLAVKDKKSLLELEKRCRDFRLPCSLISDAGLTELRSGTTTCLGIGPDEEKKINKVTGSLPLMK